MNNNRPICFNVALLRICLRVIASLLTGFVLLLGILSLLDHHDEKTQVVLADNEPVVFTDVTSLAGVDTSSPSAQWGSVWGDYDGDGYQDLYVGNHFYSPNLYRNNGDGTFTDMRASAGIPSGPNDWHGAAWGDYDNDGDLELYVTTGRAINHGNFFYDNNGDGTFIERASAVGIANIGGRGRIPSWIDFDNDGDLDLHVANAVSETAPDVLFRNNGDGTFTDVAAQAGIALNDWSHGATWSDYDGDGYLDFGLTMIGDTFRLYHNQGNGTFVNATASAGIGNYWVESVAWGDYDNDGDSDLYICRLYEDYQDRLVWNTHTMTIVVGTIPGEQEGIDFTTTVPTVSFDLWQSDRVHLSSEITFGSANLHPPDVPFTLDSTTNHIGQPSYAPGQDSGVFIWRDSPTGQWHVRWTGDPRTFQGQITTSGEFGGVTSVGLDIPYIPPFERPNVFYENDGDGTFTRSDPPGLENEDVFNSRGAQWVDFDNDGDLDLYVTNHGDTQNGNRPNWMYQNNGDGTFTEVSGDVGLDVVIDGNDLCSAWADYDNDGFLDLFMSNSAFSGLLAGSHKLYRNGGNSNHWLQIQLVGAQSNRLGIGAKIQVSTGDLDQFREVSSQSSRGCHNSLVAHFGLGSYTQADAITVTWPSGHVQVLHDEPADQILKIVESQSLVISQSSPATVSAGSLLTYTLSVSHLDASGETAAEIIVTDTLPAFSSLVGMDFVPPAGGIVYSSSMESSGVVSWVMTSAVAPGDTAEVVLTVRVHSPLTDGIVITNTCGMTAALLSGAVQCDPLTVTVSSAPIVTISKHVYPGQVRVGDVVTYTITIANSGNETAYNVPISDTLPVGFEPASMQWQRNITGMDLAGEFGVVTLTFTATTPVTAGNYTNVARAIVKDEAILSNLASVMVFTPGVPVLAMGKTVHPKQVEQGSAVTYTIVLTNYGNETAYGVRISDTLPAGFEPAVMQWQCTVTGTDLAGTPGVVSFAFTATALVDPGSYTNTARAAWGEKNLITSSVVLSVTKSVPDYYLYLPVLFLSSRNF